jgi:hypothetical protein
VLHARACDAGVADPVDLAAWMVRFGFVDQDFFEVDPVRYASALGEDGLAAYRDAVSARRDGDSFAVRYARERLAILDGDVDALVKLLDGDLASPYQFIRVAEAMRELALDDEVLAWAKRGIARTSGWQVSQLYDLACGVHDAREEPLEVLALRRAQHERMPSSSTYRALRTAAEALGAWRSSKARRARRCSGQTCAGTSTRSSGMASSGSPGVRLSQLPRTRSVPTSGSGSPRAASEMQRRYRHGWGQSRARRGVACSHQSGLSPCSRSQSSVLAVEYTCAPPPVQKVHSFCVARL